MNERIKELEKLATEVEHSHGAFGEHEKYYRLNTEKFAELIVRECLDVVDKVLRGYASSIPSGMIMLITDELIRKHFRIEE